MIDVLRRQIAYYIYKLGILKDNQYNKFKLVIGEISKPIFHVSSVDEISRRSLNSFFAPVEIKALF